nr:MAG TPA: hypothetical protein [Caudoviricetes sp.]
MAVKFILILGQGFDIRLLKEKLITSSVSRPGAEAHKRIKAELDLKKC